MPTDGLSKIAVDVMRLQNAYALAIDTRDWDLFRTLFTPDVQADYPHSIFDGMSAWLENFIPFHDACAWTLHEMTNHVVGEDARGIWGTCYGWIRWTARDDPGRVNRTEVLYRDRLRQDDGEWRIARRNLRLLSSHPQVPVGGGYTLVQSVLDLANWT